MDKNIAALMRNDVRTVTVRFYKDRYDSNAVDRSLGLGATFPEAALSDKFYLYVTDLPFLPGDHAIVMVCGIPKIVRVDVVHDGLEIEPNDDIYYKWVVSKVDFMHYNENLTKNKEITDLVASAYKKNIRKQFNMLLLEGLDDEARTRLLGVIDTKAGETEIK